MFGRATITLGIGPHSSYHLIHHPYYFVIGVQIIGRPLQVKKPNSITLAGSKLVGDKFRTR